MSGTPLSAFKLTYDILLHMISLYSCASEAVPLIATCRVLYHEGAKIALKKPVVIFDATELASFLKFLHAENSSRCRYLRELDIWGFHAEPEVVQELLEILPLFVNIETLQLASAEQFLVSDPALPMAFAALTSLRHVDVCGASDVTCTFLSSLHSPLVSATVDFITDHDDDSTDLWDRLAVDQWPIYHPTALLGNLSSTLEELRCVSWSTTPDSDIAIRSDKVYTNMRKLSIDVHDLPLRIDPFICAFPNLTDLNVHTDNFYDPIYETDLEAMRTSHETNVGQQLTSCGTWTSLEHFTGRLSDLYAIGLTCRIGRITIVDDVGDELRMGMLATVLRYAKPLHLKLKGIACSMLPSFISTLRSEGASDLLNLDVCIYSGEEDRDRDLTVVVDNLVSTLTCLRLKFLQLRFGAADLDLTPTIKRALEETLRLMSAYLPDHPGRASASQLDPAREHPLASLDMDVLVARLESIPSLEAALVVLSCSCSGGENIERTITKGTSRLAGHEQWRSWLHGKNRFMI